MTGSKPDHRLRLSDGWTETHYEDGQYGPADKPGLTVTMTATSMTVRVLPARYEASDGEERVRSLVDDLELTWRDPTTFVPDVPRQVAFVVLADYDPVGGSERAIYTVTADAGDALAAAVWLANGSPDPGALHRNIR